MFNQSTSASLSIWVLSNIWTNCLDVLHTNDIKQQIEWYAMFPTLEWIWKFLWELYCSRVFRTNCLDDLRTNRVMYFFNTDIVQECEGPIVCLSCIQTAVNRVICYVPTLEVVFQQWDEYLCFKKWECKILCKCAKQDWRQVVHC